MRILYFYPEVIGSNMFQWQRNHFINELTNNGCVIETFNPLLFNEPDEANEELLKLIKKHSFDLFISSICHKGLLHIDTLQLIKKTGIPTMSIRWDNLVRPYGDKELSKYFDLLWLTSKETKNLYNSWGVNSFFAPYAANPSLFNGNFPKSFDRAVCFIGTPYGSRSKMLNTLTQANLTVKLHFGKPLAVENQEDPQQSIKYNISDYDYSPLRMVIDWLRYPEGRKLISGAIFNKLYKHTQLELNSQLVQLPSIPPSKMAEHYSSYSLALASTSTNHTDVLREPLKIVNLRNFEIPMCGGLEICKYNPELAEYFEDDKEIIFYSSDDELIDKARYYTQKASDSEIMRMKTAARDRALRDHTWTNRFNKAFDMLGLKK